MAALPLLDRVQAIACIYWESVTLAWRYLGGDQEAGAGIYPVVSAALIPAGVPLYGLVRQKGVGT